MDQQDALVAVEQVSVGIAPYLEKNDISGALARLYDLEETALAVWANDPDVPIPLLAALAAQDAVDGDALVLAACEPELAAEVMLADKTVVDTEKPSVFVSVDDATARRIRNEGKRRNELGVRPGRLHIHSQVVRIGDLEEQQAALAVSMPLDGKDRFFIPLYPATLRVQECLHRVQMVLYADRNEEWKAATLLALGPELIAYIYKACQNGAGADDGCGSDLLDAIARLSTNLHTSVLAALERESTVLLDEVMSRCEFLWRELGIGPVQPIAAAVAAQTIEPSADELAADLK